MVLTEEQVRELKNQLKSQITHLPLDQRKQAEEHIDSMSAESIEAMLTQQKARQEIYRMVVRGELDSVIVQEDENLLAVMEIRPLSRGHVLVIPKKQVKDIPKISNEIIKEAQKLQEKIKNNLNAKEVVMQPIVKFGEAIIELVPVYDEPITKTENREQVSKEELEKVAEEIKREVIKIEKKTEIIENRKVAENSSETAEPLKLKRRIP